MVNCQLLSQQRGGRAYADEPAVEDVLSSMHVRHDFSFTQMMQQYGMGGVDTGPQEASQSLRSTAVTV